MSAAMNREYKPDYAIHPGEILEETLEVRGMSKTEFAERCGLSLKTISQIVNRKAFLTPSTALQFEKVLGVSADIWNNLDSYYRLFIARQEKGRESDAREAWAKNFPLAELKKRGIVTNSRDKVKAADELLSFFRVASADAWQDLYGNVAASFRRSQAYSGSAESVATWLRIAESIAEDIETDPFDSRKLLKSAMFLRGITDKDPGFFEPKMRELCMQSGVALIFLAELPKTRLSGATRWLASNKAMIALSLRHKSDDQFWFTFFHEVGHVMLHGKRRVFIDSPNGDEDTLEAEADRFACNILVPSSQYKKFKDRGRFFEQDIMEFAEQMGVAPGIVVGMLQHDNLIQYKWHNNLKRRFELVDQV